MRRSPWLSSVALLAAFGCGQPRHATPPEEITFRVDSARLGERFEDPGRGLALRAPSHWDPLPAAAVREGMRRVRAAAGADSLLEPQMLALYLEGKEGASLTVSHFVQEYTIEARDSLTVRYLTHLKSRSDESHVEQSRYSYRGFEVIQFRVIDPQAVHFKLLISRPRTALFQLDYFIPRGVYERELESIESSIGSLQPLS